MSLLLNYTYNQNLQQSVTLGGVKNLKEDHVHLSYGFPNSDLFPLSELAEAAATSTLTNGRNSLHYSGGSGTAVVRQWISNRLEKRNIQASPQEIVVTAGAGQAIDVTARVLVNQGDEVWIENPSFFGAIRSFELAGATLKAFDTDDNGLVVSEVERELEERVKKQKTLPKFIYVMPNFHNPTGVTLTLERRKQLAALAKKYGFYILEDDAYAELQYAGETLPAIYSFAPNHVIYTGTFSKIIAPGIRLGWVVANADLLSYYSQFLLGSQTNPYTQEIIAYFLQDNEFEPYLQKLIAAYSRQLEFMIERIDEEFGDAVTYTRPSGGFFITITFKVPIEINKLVEKAEFEGVSIVGGAAFYIDQQSHQKVRLCFTYSNEAAIEKGISRLAKAYNRLKETVSI